MRQTVIKLLMGLSVVVFGLEAKAEDPASSLTESLQKIQNFQAHFVQKIKDANGQPVSKTQGKVSILRPGKFYWKSQAPDPVLVVADGKFLWTYDIELAQVTKQEQHQALGNSPAALLAGSVNHLAQDFSIAYAQKNECSKNSDQCYTLHPLKKESQFANILIGFDKGKLVEIRMHDPLGQDINTVFSDVKVNAALDKKIFSFSPPKGVDIIHGGK